MTLGKAKAVYLLLGAVLLLGGDAPAVPDPTDAERDGYLLWLHSLDRTADARAQSRREAERRLFPFDQPSWDPVGGATPYRHLAIGKAVRELERRRAERARDLSPLVALANARNYVNLSEYDSALVWYGVTARADTAGRFASDVAREALAAALAAGDSAETARRVTNTLGRTDIARRPDEAALAYRWLLVSRDTRGADVLIGKVAAVDSLLTPRLRFWHARALAWRERRDEALHHLLHLVRDAQGRSLGLGDQERAWVATTIPDLYWLGGNTGTARRLYRHLAEARTDALALWGRYQTAGLDLAAGRYRAAAAGFAAVCEGPRQGPWQDRACDLRGLAEEMERIRAEGEPYGTAAMYRR